LQRGGPPQRSGSNRRWQLTGHGFCGLLGLCDGHGLVCRVDSHEFLCDGSQRSNPCKAGISGNFLIDELEEVGSGAAAVVAAAMGGGRREGW
jgi:uncharacterized NAD-dependent epimerase/dehydratase family protein